MVLLLHISLGVNHTFFSYIPQLLYCLSVSYVFQNIKEVRVSAILNVCCQMKKVRENCNLVNHSIYYMFCTDMHVSGKTMIVS